MQPPILHTIHKQKFWLSAQRSLFWEEQKALIVSDLHLGKSGHFRKAGIPVPQQVLKEDMQRLVTLLHHFNPEKLIVVGDFFHSTANLELDFFIRWRGDISQQIILVRGNHDILKKEWYASADIDVIESHLCIDRFCFSHDLYEVPEGLYTFSGHIHPGVLIHGLGKQSLRFPCFYFTEDYCVLPAFGKFTGLATVQPTKDDTVFAVVENAVIKM
ncbi:MAG: metallophosphoesterase [Flaviaesturariibacter sp.]|nr:metallophosphoesterase [Flaviaesturariibacter sp.]